MDEPISRQAAIDAVIKHLQLEYEYAWGVREAINPLPSVQPEPRWIPVSERLPGKVGRYLCTVGAAYRNPREMIYAPDNFICGKDQNTWRDVAGHRVFNWFVTAWMPLPEPWKG